MSFTYPEIPSVKLHSGEKISFTPEAIVIQKLSNKQEISLAEENILKESLQFYKKLYPFLKSVDLSSLTDVDADELLTYTFNALGMNMNPTNDIQFKRLYRVTKVGNTMLEDGKVRELKYLLHRPIELVQRQGYFGRLNSTQTTVFYCSFSCEVAIVETKPKEGDRMIITEWHNDYPNAFVSCPLAYNKGITNRNADIAVEGYETMKNGRHPMLIEIMDLYMDFFGSELIKNTQVISRKSFEYLYSAFFGDLILGSNQFPGHYGPGTRASECIIYPSVAFNHKEENLAIAPEFINRLRPIACVDIIVSESMYNKPGWVEKDFPIKFEFNRKSNKFNGNNIVWDDD